MVSLLAAGMSSVDLRVDGHKQRSKSSKVRAQKSTELREQTEIALVALISLDCLDCPVWFGLP